MVAELRMDVEGLNLLIEGMQALIDQFPSDLVSDAIAMKKDLEDDIRAISH